MLVLSRRIGERVLLPELQITITVVAIEGNTVRLGIAAPAEIPVYREEVWRRIQSQTQPQTEPPKDACPETLAEL